MHSCVSSAWFSLAQSLHKRTAWAADSVQTVTKWQEIVLPADRQTPIVQSKATLPTVLFQTNTPCNSEVNQSRCIPWRYMGGVELPLVGYSTKQRWMVSFKFRSLYLRGKSTCESLTRGTAEYQSYPAPVINSTNSIFAQSFVVTAINVTIS